MRYCHAKQLQFYSQHNVPQLHDIRFLLILLMQYREPDHSKYYEFNRLSSTIKGYMVIYTPYSLVTLAFETSFRMPKEYMREEWRDRPILSNGYKRAEMIITL